jgi:hypothetical protein
MQLISDEALALVVAAESADPAERFSHRRAAARLDEEFGSLRRLGLAVVSLAAIVVGGMSLGIAVDSLGDDAGLVALCLVVSLVLAVPGAVLGTAIVRAGDRVRRAYAVWVADDAFGSPSRGAMVERLFSGRSILRSALTAFALIGAIFSWAFFGLSVAPSDPIEVDDLRPAMATMTLVWAAALTASTWFLFMGELRMGWAHSRSVIRDL